MKRNKLLLLLFLSFSLSLQAQEPQKLSYKLYGFVENQFNYNSRKNIESTGTAVNLMPLPEIKDPEGKDLNKVQSTELISVNTRLGVDVYGLKLFNANLLTKIEADFSGTGSTYFLLRLRRAYVDMEWEKSRLLVGQDWHPMSSALMPTTFELNGGAPFNPFNRSPQVNFTYRTGIWKFTAAALYQMQYCSDGPQGKNPVYLRDAVMPDFYVGVENKIKHFRYGIGGDVKTIAPRTKSTVNGVDYAVDERLTSFAVMAYGQYAQNKLDIKLKATYGQNMTDLLLIGGYGVSDVKNETTGEREYASFNSFNSWFNITYGSKWKVGLLAGYAQNLGTDKELTAGSPVYGYGFAEGLVIDQLYKIAPMVSYSISGWKFGLELGFTTAGYGELNTETGKAVSPKEVTNYRILSALSYSF